MVISHTLPPGKYFIGDPSVVFDQRLDVILKATDFFNSPEPAAITGGKVWGQRANSNASEFTDQNGTPYQVNDGVLGCVSIELVEDPAGEELGTVVDAPQGMKVVLDKGVFHFNEIVINTNDPFDTDFDGGYDLDPDLDQFI